MREFPGYVEFCESKSGVRSCLPSRCGDAAQGGMVIVLIHSVKVQSLILGESLRGTPSLKRRASKAQCKGASPFCQNKQVVSKNLYSLGVLIRTQ